MDLFNKITSNGCREMTEARFNEALKEYKQTILTLVDIDEERIKQVAIDESQQDWNDWSYRQVHEEAFIKGVNWLLTELKQKIEAL